MNEIVVPKVILLEQLEEFIDTGNIFDAVKIHLYMNDFDPNDQSVIGDFTQANFTGYAPSAALVWGTPGYGANGRPTVAAPSVTFTGGTPFTVPNTIYGYYATDSAGTKLLWSERFEVSKTIAQTGDMIAVLPAYPNFQPQN